VQGLAARNNKFLHFYDLLVKGLCHRPVKVPEAAVGILPATILAADVCVIENLPDISDVAVSLKILSTLGAQVKMLNRNTYEIDTTHLTGTNVPDDLSRQMRASYYFLGALLSRFGRAQVAMPGGCNLGPRPIDQHLKVFSALGAEDRRGLRH